MKDARIAKVNQKVLAACLDVGHVLADEVLLLELRQGRTDLIDALSFGDGVQS